MSERRINIIIAIILIIFSVVVWFMIPHYIQDAWGVTGVSAKFFPKFSVIALIGLSLMLIFQNLPKEDKEYQNADYKDQSVSRMFLSIFLIVAYIYLVTLIGFIIATLLTMLVFMWFFRVRSIKSLILIPIFTTAVLFYIFQFLLKVQLPSGIFY